MLSSLNWRKIAIMVFVLGALIESAGEIFSEIAAGQPFIEMVDDVAMFVLAIVVVALFVWEYVQQQTALAELRMGLQNSRGKLARLDANSTQIASQYRRVMQKQFDAWNLTASEQDVVLALLKGLSFREVAEIRDTREKTVRQQAANVYRKAGVAGRHELAGWFFEDLLQSPHANGDLRVTRNDNTSVS